MWIQRKGKKAAMAGGSRLADRISREERSEIMSRIRSKDTSPEIALRKKLWKMGCRYRLHYGKEKIDIAFPGKSVAVFVDGCFWHSCPFHGRIPKSNGSYWGPKLKRNAERANSKDSRLQADGWRIIHVWEHSIRESAESCAKEIMAALSEQA